MRGLYFLAAAYTAVWAGFFFYLLSLGRRAGRLEKELDNFRDESRSDS